jgi:hypothetical protein
MMAEGKEVCIRRHYQRRDALHGRPVSYVIAMLGGGGEILSLLSLTESGPTFHKLQNFAYPIIIFKEGVLNMTQKVLDVRTESDSLFRVPGSGFRVPGSGFRVPGSGFRVPGSGFRVLCLNNINVSWARRTAHASALLPQILGKPYSINLQRANRRTGGFISAAPALTGLGMCCCAIANPLTGG